MTGRARRALRRKYNAQRRKNQRALSRFARQHGWMCGRTTAPFAQRMRDLVDNETETAVRRASS